MADGSPVMTFDPYAARAQFPILSRTVNGKPLVYLDSAASAQKPRAVIDALTAAMEHSYANVHRGLHTLANETTEAFEAAREGVARFLNAEAPTNIVWTKGGTEAINLADDDLVAGLDRLTQPGRHQIDRLGPPLGPDDVGGGLRIQEPRHALEIGRAHV